MRILGKTTAVTVGIIGGLTALSIAFTAGTGAWSEASADYYSATNTSQSEVASANALASSIESGLATSASTAAAAAGQVEDPTIIPELVKSASSAKAALDALTKSAKRNSATTHENTLTSSAYPWEYPAATKNVQAASAVHAIAAARDALAELGARQKAVDDATNAWHQAQTLKAEQDRLAAESVSKAAAAQAAQAAAARTAVKVAVQAPVTPKVSSSVQGKATAAAAALSSPYSVNVRTTVTAGSKRADGSIENGQSAIDAGGQVAIVWPAYGTEVVAHNFNDALALKLIPGDIVNFTGAVTGSYRVTGSITVPQNSSSSVLGQVGTKMMMQTCVFDSVMMRIVGLEPA